MAVADEIAAQAAKDALAKELEGKFNYVGEAYSKAQEAARANTQNIIDQLTQKGTDYQEQFNKDARSAYINKMQRGQQLEGELSRLGLGNAGYGVTQRLMNESSYGTNLADLQNALSKNLTAIDQSKATAGTDLGNTLADLAMKQASQQTSIDQYIIGQLQNAYDTAYNRSYQERQDEAERQLAYAQLYARSSGSSGGGGSSKTATQFEWTPGTTYLKNKDGSYTYTNPNGKKVTVSAGENPYTGTVNKDVKNGTFGNGYQPNNINNKKLTSVGETVNMYGNQQNVWTTGKKNYVWSGLDNKYIEVYKDNGQWVVK